MRLVAIFLLIILNSCSFPFIPLVPVQLEHTPVLQVSSSSSFKQSGEQLILNLDLREVPKEDYLSAFLYKDGTKVAEDSKLVNIKDETIEFSFPFSTTGQYRVMLFWQGSIVRQFELVLN